MQTVNFWAIGDSHLSLSKPRDLAIFGEHWRDHTERIAQNWRERVAPEDVVLLLGDVSWSHTYKHVKPDLQWVASLPGRKVMVRGNHDRWWRDIREVRRYYLPENFYALQGDCLEVEGVLLCGAQGHITPTDPYYAPDPPANRFERELATLQSALAQVETQRRPDQPLIIMMHYPPFTSDGNPTIYSQMIEQHAPAICLYGHLHKPDEWEVAVEGERNGIFYRLVAADYIHMKPQLVLSVPQPESLPVGSGRDKTSAS